MKYDAEFQDFVAKVHARLEQGEQTYGDASLSLDPQALLDEVECEILDVLGWTFILHVRLQHLRPMVQRLQEHADVPLVPLVPLPSPPVHVGTGVCPDSSRWRVRPNRPDPGQPGAAWEGAD